jgi:hypothetical protein
MLALHRIERSLEVDLPLGEHHFLGAGISPMGVSASWRWYQRASLNQKYDVPLRERFRCWQFTEVSGLWLEVIPASRAHSGI